jgi:hypothetical protein
VSNAPAAPALYIDLRNFASGVAPLMWVSGIPALTISAFGSTALIFCDASLSICTYAAGFGRGCQ